MVNLDLAEKSEVSNSIKISCSVLISDSVHLPSLSVFTSFVSFSLVLSIIVMVKEMFSIPFSESPFLRFALISWKTIPEIDFNTVGASVVGVAGIGGTWTHLENQN